MLYAFGFDRIGVAVGDLYFVNPEPEQGQEGPEQGVRLEVRVLGRPPRPGSVYSAQPISVDRPLWRADLLESVPAPGTLDRAHHHPRFRGWEPGPRHFDPAMTADPVGWVARRLGDLSTLLAEAAAPPGLAGPNDAAALAVAIPEVMAAVDRLLVLVRAGPTPGPENAGPAGVRIGWL